MRGPGRCGTRAWADCRRPPVHHGAESPDLVRPARLWKRRGPGARHSRGAAELSGCRLGLSAARPSPRAYLCPQPSAAPCRRTLLRAVGSWVQRPRRSQALPRTGGLSGRRPGGTWERRLPSHRWHRAAPAMVAEGGSRQASRRVPSPAHLELSTPHLAFD